MRAWCGTGAIQHDQHRLAGGVICRTAASSSRCFVGRHRPGDVLLDARAHDVVGALASAHEVNGPRANVDHLQKRNDIMISSIVGKHMLRGGWWTAHPV